MWYLETKYISILIHTPIFTEETLDFILGASNITESIIVIFAYEGVKQMNHFKALKGFGIESIYAEEKSLQTYNIPLEKCVIQAFSISDDIVKKYVTHSQQIFAF